MFGRRLVLAALIAVAGVAGGAACGKGGAAAVAVVPGQPAGVVREVSGTVTATRPGAPARTLATGDTVSGDDELDTGADGSVLIELDHNHVTFTLPAGKKQKVGASLAWNQPVAAARPTTSDESSAAAGRPIERSAVDTAASSAPPPATAVAPPLAQPVAPPPAEQDSYDGKADRKAPAPAPAPPPPPPPPKPTKTTRPADVPPEPAMARDLAPGATGGSPSADQLAGVSESAKASDEAGGGGPPDTKAAPRLDVADKEAPAPAFAFALTVTGGLAERDVGAKITLDTVRGCVKSPLTITIVIDSTGKLGRITTSADSGTTTCVRAKLGKIRFGAKKSQTTVVVTVK